MSRLERTILRILDERQRDAARIDWNGIESHPDISIGFIDQTLDTINWNLYKVLESGKITQEFINARSQAMVRQCGLRWILSRVLEKLDFQILLNGLFGINVHEVIRDQTMNSRILCRNSGLPIDFIQQYADTLNRSQWKELSRHNAQPGELFRMFRVYVNQKHLCRNRAITEELVLQFLPEIRKRKWLVSCMSLRPEFIIANQLDVMHLETYPSLTIEFIYQHKCTTLYNMYVMMPNPGIRILDMLTEQLDLANAAQTVSKNPNLSVEFLALNIFYLYGKKSMHLDLDDLILYPDLSLDPEQWCPTLFDYIIRNPELFCQS